MFLPTTKEEMKKLKWDSLDIILITGDTYIDSPYIGAAIIGKVLYEAGYKVGIIAQPDINTDDVTRLGEPNLFFGITAGSVDSMVANYTASLKKRRNDDYTPGGVNNKRPDRATIIYCNLIKKFFKSKKPIVLGGIEASLRRIAHYDYWTDKIRKSILFDSKGDILVYGMGEKTILEIADKLKTNQSIESVRGICYISKEKRDEYTEIPSYEEVCNDKLKFIEMFKEFYKNNDPITANGLQQKHLDRYLIQNPPQYFETTQELDSYYDLNFEYDVHPFYKKDGNVKALDTIKFSLTTHRGCYGECNFCAITVHQGNTIRNRSESSIVNEAKKFTKLKDFKGYILDVGGPTANMYNIECEKKINKGCCSNKRCLSPNVCNNLKINHKSQINLLDKLRKIDGIKKVFVASGIRYDMVLNDKENGINYIEHIVKYNTSGQLKIAPEHTEKKVLDSMGKPDGNYLLKFKEIFDKINKDNNLKQFLTYYIIAAYPDCNLDDMKSLKKYVEKNLKTNIEQVQIFTPTPSTFASIMYYTELNPFTLKPVFVEKSLKNKTEQKEVIVPKEIK